jgi:hypothetical protein
MMQPCPEDATWIEVRLVDQDGTAMPGEKYRIRLPDSSLMEARRRSLKHRLILEPSTKLLFCSLASGTAVSRDYRAARSKTELRLTTPTRQ